MAYSFVDALQRSATTGDWSVMSRGVMATSAPSICGTVRSLIDRTPDGARFAEMHASTVVAMDDLETQDLFITATRDERARLARLAPAQRERTFTLREAVALGGASTLTAYNEPETLAEYAALLNSRRGRAQIAQPAQGRDAWASRRHPMDIPDVHSSRSKHHLSTLQDITTTVRTLHDQVARYLPAQ